VLGGFNRPEHFTAMAIGVAVYVTCYTWLSAHPVWGRSTWVRAVGWAAWTKVGLCVLGVVVWMGIVPLARNASGPSWLQAVLVTPIYLSTLGIDLFSGIAALKAGNFLATANGGVAAEPFSEGARAGFAGTLLTTLVQGLFVSAQLVVLALLVRGWWWWRGNSFALAATENRG
jgi:hypothetical protein